MKKSDFARTERLVPVRQAINRLLKRKKESHEKG
jgi:hypothetical protein